MLYLAIAQIHGQSGFRDQLHFTIIWQSYLSDCCSVLIELHRQASGTSELIGIILIACIAQEEAQIDWLAKIHRCIGGKLFDGEVILLGLLYCHIVDREIPGTIVGHAVETNIKRTCACCLEHG